MKILIDGVEYTLSEQSIAAILASIERFVADHYEKLPNTTKLAAMATVRAILAYAESRESDLVKKKEIRPVKGADPTMHLIGILLKALGEVLPHVECEISAEDHHISNFSFKHAGKSGRPVPDDGNVGERKNNSSETARPEIS